jgi:hypothetical protein
MRMGIDQSRRRGSAMQVDNVGVRTGEGSYRLIRADGKNFSVADRHRVGDRVLRIDGQYVTVHENRVGSRRSRRRPTGAGGEQK